MKTSASCKCLTKLRADHVHCKSSFRGIIGQFPWRQWPPIRCKVKRLKSEVRAACLLKQRKPQTADSSACECVLLHNNVHFFPSSIFWCRTSNGINTVPRLHLIFPWRLKNLNSGFKWLDMQVCFSNLIFLKGITFVCSLRIKEVKKTKVATYSNQENYLLCKLYFQGMEFWLENGGIDFSALVLLWDRKIERDMQLIDPIFWTHGKECRTVISTKIRASKVACKYIIIIIRTSNPKYPT